MTAKKSDPKNLDPNYLTQAQSPFSPWHHALHCFRDYWRGRQGVSTSCRSRLPMQCTHTHTHTHMSMINDQACNLQRMLCVRARIGAPIFHVDVHGKMDRKDNLDLDIGMGSACSTYTQMHKALRAS